MIEAFHLQKSFGDPKRAVNAVQDVTFSAQNGRITGILGPNGAGKTTTLRMIYAVLKPDAGSVRIDGLDTATQADQARTQLGVLPDARGLYPRLTPREHLRYFGELHGLSGSILEHNIAELLTLLDMHDFANRPTEGMSMGQRLKVAIGRALVHRPTNVILDEPTNGLDVMSTRAMRDVLRRLREDGRCVLLSSHVMQEVAALCDDVVIMARGKVVLKGTPDEIRQLTGQENLEDAFVAAIGSGEGLE